LLPRLRLELQAAPCGTERARRLAVAFDVTLASLRHLGTDRAFSVTANRSGTCARGVRAKKSWPKASVVAVEEGYGGSVRLVGRSVPVRRRERGCGRTNFAVPNPIMSARPSLRTELFPQPPALAISRQQGRHVGNSEHRLGAIFRTAQFRMHARPPCCSISGRRHHPTASSY
jgi:hypothetical protein